MPRGSRRTASGGWGGARARRGARAALLGLLARLSTGGVVLVEDGGARRFGSVGPGETAPVVTVLDDRAFLAAATGGSAGLGRGYVEGWWTCDSPEDLTAFLRVLVANLGGIEAVSAFARPLRGAIRRLATHPGERPGRREADARHVRAHYDLSNDFFALFLDETMTYSSAVFEPGAVSLAAAQVAKLDRLCRRLELEPADHLLEIGTGWGSMALHAAGRYGCRVTTTTLSAAQHELATARVKEAGLEDRVTVLLEDYRDLAGRYDKLVSIEMIEALDWRQHDTYFSTCARLLEPDGLMALQAIVIADRLYERAKHTEDFIKAAVFPGSCIPSVAAITASLARASDLRLVGLEDIGEHYAETIRRWRDALSRRSDEARALGADEALLRLFAFYFAYCEAGFAERRISDVQVVLAKPAWRRRGPRRPRRPPT